MSTPPLLGISGSDFSTLYSWRIGLTPFYGRGGGSRFRVPRFYYAPLKFYLATKKDTWEQHPANLIPPLTTEHASALSVDGTPSLARCRDLNQLSSWALLRTPTCNIRFDPDETFERIFEPGAPPHEKLLSSQHAPQPSSHPRRSPCTAEATYTMTYTHHQVLVVLAPVSSPNDWWCISLQPLAFPSAMS